MTPRQRQGLQESLLDRIKAAHPGTTDAEIAAAAGCDRSLVSRWRSGEREIGLSELIGLQRRFGAAAVLGAIAEMDGCDIASRQPCAPVALRRGSLALVQGISSLAVELEEALSDGWLTNEEITGLESSSKALLERLTQLRASLKPGRAA